METAIAATPWTELTAAVQLGSADPNAAIASLGLPAFITSLVHGPSPLSKSSSSSRSHSLHPASSSRVSPPSSRSAASLSSSPSPSSSSLQSLSVKLATAEGGYCLIVTDALRVWSHLASAADVLQEKAAYADIVQLESAQEAVDRLVTPLLTETTARQSHVVSFTADTSASSPSSSLSADSAFSPLWPSASSFSPSLASAPSGSSAAAVVRPSPAIAVEGMSALLSPYQLKLTLRSSMRLGSIHINWTFHCRPCGSPFGQSLLLRHLLYSPLQSIVRSLHAQLTEERGRQAAKQDEVSVKKERTVRVAAVAAGRSAVKEEATGSAAGKGSWSLGRASAAPSPWQSPPSSSPSGRDGQEEAGALPPPLPLPSLSQLYEQSMRMTQSQQAMHDDELLSQHPDRRGRAVGADEGGDSGLPSQQPGAGSADARPAGDGNSAAALQESHLDEHGNYVESEAEKQRREAIQRSVRLRWLCPTCLTTVLTVCIAVC